MLVSTIILLVLISGSILCSARWEKKFEEIIPITSMSIILVLFIAGILGVLELGVYLVLGITLFVLVYSFCYIIKTKSMRTFFNNMCTDAFGLFIVTYFILIFLNAGRIPYSWDEFSHWADVVKAMTYLDDFGTNANAYSIYATYPPGMALFQYFFQKIFVMFDFGRTFSEWRIYHAYQVFIIIIFMPFLTRESNDKKVKRFLGVIVSYVMILLAPELLYTVFKQVYIDVVLGILTGAAFARIYKDNSKDVFSIMYILEMASMLILMKDSGMLFAIFVVLTFLMEQLFRDNCCKSKILITLIAILSIAIPKLLWSYELNITNTKGVVEYRFSINEFIRAILGIDGTYRSLVVENYVKQFFTEYTSIGNGIGISALVILSFEIVMLCLIQKYYRKRKKGNKKVIVSFIILSIIYIIGICSAYMFNFSQEEAVRLAGYKRYINAIFISDWIFIVLLMLDLIREKYIYMILMCSVQLVITPLDDVKLFVTGEYVEESQAVMNMYESWSNMVKQETDDICKIYMIYQEDQGYGRLALKYMARPNIVNPAGVAWSLGIPFYEGDIWSANKSAKEWQEELVEGYDYVLLMQLNDYFIENYSVLFDDPTTLETSTLYKVNKATGFLEACN